MNSLCEGFFSLRRNTVPMVRGSDNAYCVQKGLRQLTKRRLNASGTQNKQLRITKETRTPFVR